MSNSDNVVVYDSVNNRIKYEPSGNIISASNNRQLISNNAWTGKNQFNGDVSLNAITSLTSDVYATALASTPSDTNCVSFNTGTKKLGYTAIPALLPSNNAWTGTNTFTSDVSLNSNVYAGALASTPSDTNCVSFNPSTKKLGYTAIPALLPSNNTWTGTNTFNSNVSLNNTTTQINSTSVVGLSGGIINISGGTVNIGGGNTIINGNVGIGTQTPECALDVSGIIRAKNPGNNGAVSMVAGTNIFPGYVAFNKPNGTRVGYIGWEDSTANYFQLMAENPYLGYKVKQNLLVDGNVGIGTQSPGYKLDVSGTAHIQNELYVGQSNSGSTIYMGGGAGADNAYNFSVIETRNYANTESTELLLFKGNDFSGSTTPVGPDRIRLRASNIVFDTYNYTTNDNITDRNTENIRMLIDQDGNVGIGTKIPSAKLDINGDAVVGQGGPIYKQSTMSVYNKPGDGSFAICAGGESNKAILYLGTPNDLTSSSLSAYKAAIIANGNGSGLGWSTSDLHFCLNNTNGTAGHNSSTNTATISDSKMVIKTNGNVGIGTTNPLSSLSINGDAGANGVLQVVSNTSTGRNVDGACFKPVNNYNHIINFMNTDGILRGRITGVSGDSIDYIKTSDRRLKTNIIDMRSTKNRIKQIKTREFDWKSSNNHTYGFIAQEIFELFPEMRQINSGYSNCKCNINDLTNGILCDAENYNHDEPVDNDGKPLYYGLDYSRFVPYLIKAYQESDKEFEDTKNEFKTKVDILENTVAEQQSLIAQQQSQIAAQQAQINAILARLGM
jgi:hypothetical protein